MSISIMTMVWEHAPYDDASIMLVFLALADWANDKGYCWPTMQQLAKKSRQSERNVRYMLKRLEQDGMVTKLEERGRGHKNTYIINLQRLQVLVHENMQNMQVYDEEIINSQSYAKENLQKVKPLQVKIKPAKYNTENLQNTTLFVVPPLVLPSQTLPSLSPSPGEPSREPSGKTPPFPLSEGEPPATQASAQENVPPKRKRGDSSPLPPKKPKPQGSHFVPDDFEVTPHLQQWAAKACPLVDIEHETAAFRAWEFAKTRSDWPKAWQSWMLKASKETRYAVNRTRASPAKNFSAISFDRDAEDLKAKFRERGLSYDA